MVDSAIQMEPEIFKEGFRRVAQTVLNAPLADDGLINLVVLASKGDPGHLYIAVGLGVDSAGNGVFI